MFKLRFWWAMLRGLFSRSTDSAELYFWVTPLDCDLNLHLNNGNYLRYMDLGRWHWAFSSGTLVPMWRAGIRPMVVRVEINFKRALPLVCRFRLVTGLESAAGKTVRLTQKFYRGDHLVAEAIATAVFVKNGRAQGLEKVAPLLPASWQERVKEIKSAP
jgi:acyl-CoA thioesterase FadM